LVVLVSLTVSPGASARTVVECREPDGTITFRDRCTPGQTKTGEKRLQGSPARGASSAAEIAKKSPVVLYVVPACDTCDLLRLQLQARGIPFAETDVSTDRANQDALQAASGALTVPTVTIGTEVLKGYDRADLDARLTAVGYPAPAAKPSPADDSSAAR
jgi:glutaredoxin